MKRTMDEKCKSSRHSKQTHIDDTAQVESMQVNKRSNPDDLDDGEELEVAANDFICDVADDEMLVQATSDKAVCTNDTLEDLQRALTYEAIFSGLLEQKVLAMKRDCEERKRAKRLKRKSIGRIFFSKKLFGSTGSRKNSRTDESGSAELMRGTHLGSADGAANRCATRMRARSADEIEVVSITTSVEQQQKALKSRTRLKSYSGEPQQPVLATAATPTNTEDSVTSTLSNSSEKNATACGGGGKRSLLVHAQTHAPAAVCTSSSSGESMQPSQQEPAGCSTNGQSALGVLASGVYETASFASNENADNGGAHTSTLAEGSLTSLRDSIESLSFASSRCTVSFGGTEVIVKDNASLLYDRTRTARRLRILEAKSISAQCSPIFPRHITKLVTPVPESKPVTLKPPVPAISMTTEIPLAAVADQTRLGITSGPSVELEGMPADELESAYTRYFSRQNTSEDSANLTVSTLLNQSDSQSMHAQGGREKLSLLTDRYKSKSTSILATSPSGSRQYALVAAPPVKEKKPLTSDFMTPASYLAAADSDTQHLGETQQAHNNPPAMSPSCPDQNAARAVANGTVGNGVIANTNAANLHRMTSTSTGSSLAPVGCCTTKSSARHDKERFTTEWAAGQSGSDDEYRRRKRKYKRYHRCSDPVLVYPTPSGLQHCILSMPPSDPMHCLYHEDYAYADMQLECDKTDDLDTIVPNNTSRRHRKHRHHKHKKRHRHKKPKILVQDLETQVVKVIDPDDLPQRARWTIIATACLLLLMCLMLVGITLRMAPIIDDMVRQENERLMKETMDRARFGKNFTDTTSALMSAPGMQLTALTAAGSATVDASASAASMTAFTATSLSSSSGVAASSSSSSSLALSSTSALVSALTAASLAAAQQREQQIP